MFARIVMVVVGTLAIAGVASLLIDKTAKKTPDQIGINSMAAKVTVDNGRTFANREARVAEFQKVADATWCILGPKATAEQATRYHDYVAQCIIDIPAEV